MPEALAPRDVNGDQADVRSEPRAAAARTGGQRGFHVPSLDGIRAVAVGLVFLDHAGLRVPGSFGVTAFFFLSGYLITTLLRLEYDRSGRISIRDFYLRRVLRIFPPHYLVLVVTTGLTLAGALRGPIVRPDAFAAQLLYLSNYYLVAHGWWTGRAPGTWIYWSLSVEEHFYLAFPLLYIWLRRRLRSRRTQAGLLLCICGAVLGWRLLLVYGFGAGNDRTYVASDTRIDSILYGCVLAVLTNPMLDATGIPQRWWKLALVPAGLAGLLTSFLIRAPHFEQTFRYTLQGLALMPLFVAAIRYPGWLPFRPLNLGWVSYLGVLSYSLYLLHPTVLYGLAEWVPAPAWIRGGLAAGLSIVLAVAINRFVEKPCARLRRRLSHVAGGVTGPRPAARLAGAPGPAGEG